MSKNRLSGSDPGVPIEPEGATDDPPPLKALGRIEAVYREGEKVVVELLHHSLIIYKYPIRHFESEEWVRNRIGRWVLVDPKLPVAREMLGPHQIYRVEVDPATKERILLCVLCDGGAEIARFSKSACMKDDLKEKLREKLDPHILGLHPEILDQLK